MEAAWAEARGWKVWVFRDQGVTGKDRWWGGWGVAYGVDGVYRSVSQGPPVLN